MKNYSPAQIKSGFRKSVAILFLLSLAASLAIKLYSGDEVGYFPGAHGRWVGELLGAALVPFVVAMIFFGLVRMMRNSDAPMAGLITGIVVTLILWAIQYQAANLHMSGVL